MIGFQGPTALAEAQLAFEAFAFDLINLSRHSFSQGELKGGNNYKNFPFPIWNQLFGILDWDFGLGLRFNSRIGLVLK